VNLILHNNLTVEGVNGMFGAQSNIKNLNIVGGDNGGFYMPYSTNSYIVNISDCYVENLKIHLKTYRNTNNFSFKNVTNSVELLAGSQFGSISDLPYVTRAGWVEFFNSLPVANSSGSYTNKINIATSYYDLLSEEDKLIALDKGYTLVAV
jgi:hypothetical protein